MPLLLLPSKHWLIALVPLSVAGAALLWKGHEHSPVINQGKTTSQPLPPVQSQKEIKKQSVAKPNLHSAAYPINPQGNPGAEPENTNGPSIHGKIKESIMKLNEEFMSRQIYLREMQKRIEISLSRIDREKIGSSGLSSMQQETENIDFNEIELINHLDSLLNSSKADLKRLMKTEARNVQRAKEQLRSYRELLYEMKRMAFKKTGRFNIDID